MADIAISYSHMNTDLAESLRRRAIERGFSVWMDNADGNHDGMESIAIPWGQSHWDVISQEFIRASVVIAIDTPQWGNRSTAVASWRSSKNGESGSRYSQPASCLSIQAEATDRATKY